MDEIFENVFELKGDLYTVNLDPGEKVYGEELIKRDGVEYRRWDPNRSKLSAALRRGLDKFPLKEGTKVLYLGAAQGTTPSHVSDIIGRKGIVYLVEFSERAMRDLLELCERRGNMVPILADARKPEEYNWVEKVDLLYQDVAQPDQIKILRRNAKKFLREDGWIMIAVKARAIDVSKEPKEIYEEIKPGLEKDFDIFDFLELDPYEGDHGFILARKR